MWLALNQIDSITLCVCDSADKQTNKHKEQEQSRCADVKMSRLRGVARFVLKTTNSSKYMMQKKT